MQELHHRISAAEERARNATLILERDNYSLWQAEDQVLLCGLNDYGESEPMLLTNDNCLMALCRIVSHNLEGFSKELVNPHSKQYISGAITPEGGFLLQRIDFSGIYDDQGGYDEETTAEVVVSLKIGPGEQENFINDLISQVEPSTQAMWLVGRERDQIPNQPGEQMPKNHDNEWGFVWSAR